MPAGAEPSIAGLYAILDWPDPHGLAPTTLAEAMIAGGAQVLQLRAKQATQRELSELIASLGPICAAAEVPLIVNDALELAEARPPGLSGVHLGQGDLHRLGSDHEARRAALRAAGLTLGISTHDLDQLRITYAALAPDYLGFGPVFPTASKANPDPTVGLAGLRSACAQSPIPVVAIGGIGVETAASVAAAGAAAVAAIGALRGSSPDAVRERCCALAAAFATGVA